MRATHSNQHFTTAVQDTSFSVNAPAEDGVSPLPTGIARAGVSSALDEGALDEGVGGEGVEGEGVEGEGGEAIRNIMFRCLRGAGKNFLFYYIFGCQSNKKRI